jgi:hypothetical protein
MPRSIDSRDKLYRKVNPEHYDGDQLLPDVFYDKHEHLSVNLASFSTPISTLQKFSKYKPVWEKCGTANPTVAQMFNAGYRVAVIPVQAVIDLGLSFEPESNGDEYTQDGHVNIHEGKLAAASLAARAQLLSLDEMYADILPLQG